MRQAMRPPIVYAPKDKKRDMMRQLEAALYTLNLPQEQEIEEISISPELLEEKPALEAVN